ncbi:hypothetical protein BHE74_00002585, partial [Ensete ventricosum]
QSPSASVTVIDLTCEAMDAGAIHEALSPKHLRKQLAATVRKIQWSYSIFWSPSTIQPG